MSKAVHSLILALAAVVVLAAAGGGAFAADRKERARAERALREGEFAVAEKIYRELVEKDLKDLTARLGLSYAQFKQRNLRDAYDNAARALALDATSSRAHAILGSALLASGDFPLSVEEFKTALSFDQNEALAVAGLSMINLYENRTQVALDGLRRAVNLDPNEPDFVFNYAQAAARSEHYKEAADAYETFLRIAPRTDADRRARIRGLIDFLRFISTQGELYKVGGASRVQVPFELVNSRPIVNVRLNGSKKFLRFVVDTGSGMSVVSVETAQRLGIKTVARGGLARAVGGGGHFEIVYGFLDSFQLGDARVSNIPVYIREFHNTQEPVDGYIGLSMLSHFLTTVDYGEQVFSLLRDDARPAPSPEPAAAGGRNSAAATATDALAAAAASPTPRRVFEIPIRSTSSGFWSGLVQIEGVSHPTNFIIDTGATVSVVSTQLAERETLSRFEQKFRLSVYGAAGVTEGVPLLMLPRVAVGDYAHPNLAAAVLDMNPLNETSGFEQAGIIGGNVLRYFRVTFDFRRGVLRLEMIPNFTPAPISKDASVTPQGLE
jgi:predicted aspartyl protease/cytochrome c-type biogenesis protein CcmH/NrfG